MCFPFLEFGLLGQPVTVAHAGGQSRIWVTGRGSDPVGCKMEELLINHLINTTGSDRIISLIHNELQFLKSADKNSAPILVRVYGSIEKNVVRLEIDRREVDVEELDRLDLLKILPVNRSVHQQTMRGRGCEGYPVGEHELTLQTGNAPAAV